MNIFVTDKCPRQSAKNLDDKRVIKMVLESAQLLSTVIYIKDSDLHNKLELYRPTHQHHPCTKWVAGSSSNSYWLLLHFKALLKEYYKRYNKVHKCSKYLPLFRQYFIEDTLPTKFVNCARNKSLGIDYTNISNTYIAYQSYLKLRWETDKRIPTRYGRPLRGE